MKQSFVFNTKLRFFQLANGNGLNNGILVYAAKPDFRRALIKVFRDAIMIEKIFLEIFLVFLNDLDNRILIIIHWLFL